MICRDRPASEMREIEITPTMVEAGIYVLLKHCPSSATGDISDQRMVAEIFEEMTATADKAVLE
jgi:hypothetical protein